MSTELKPADAEVHVGEGSYVHAQVLLFRLLVSAPFGLTAVVLSMFPALQFVGWQWVVAAASVPVTTWGAWPFHRAAFIAGRHGSTTMDTLVSLGVIASSLWSWWALIFGGAGQLGMRMSMSFLPRTASHHADIYFEGACTIVLFLLLGRYLEARTRYRAGDALRALLNLGAKEATLIITDPHTRKEAERRILASDLAVGDVFLVRPGEKVATDGVVEDGFSAIDFSLLTGEATPVDVGPGSRVTGATVNTWGALRVRAERVGADTAFARISRMVTAAQASKAPVQRLADKISSVFVPVVILISVATFVAWLAFCANLQAAFTAGVAVLVVACPCALGLATPTALLVGSGRASQLGILMKSAEVLEQTRSIDTVVLDKTGTVTTGRMSVEALHLNENADFDVDVVALAAGVESASEHPLARAITAYASQRDIQALNVTGFSNHAGLGVSAVVEVPGHGEALALVGRVSWLESLGVSTPEDLRAQLEKARHTGGTTLGLAVVPNWAEATRGTHESSEGQQVLSALEDASALEVVTMSVQGMTCASCVRRVERKLSKLEGVSASVNLATESATITLHSAHSDAQLEGVVHAAGYSGHVVQRVAATPALHEAEGTSTPVGSPSAGRVLSERLEGAQMLGVFVVRDGVKPGSAEAIKAFHQLGVEAILLTGDSRGAAEYVAKQCGIQRVVAEVLPEQKRDFVAQLQSAGHVVAMVGDGVNDAAALAQASVQGLGLAMGSGTDLAIEVADMTLVNSDLSSAPTAIRIARRTLATIKGNLFWAFAYNVAMIPLAVAGLLNPMIAAGAMAFSSVFVVLNSLRLRAAS